MEGAPKQNYKWKKTYTIVMVANIIYVILFYCITQYFTK